MRQHKILMSKGRPPIFLSKNLFLFRTPEAGYQTNKISGEAVKFVY